LAALLVLLITFLGHQNYSLLRLRVGQAFLPLTEPKSPGKLTECSYSYSALAASAHPGVGFFIS
jgi:hypothetical protein